MKRITYSICALTLAVLTAACGDDSNAVLVVPTPSLLSNEFTGTLTPNGATSYPFNVLSSGPVTGTIVSLSPDVTQVVGFGIGIWDGLSCQATPGIWNDRATQNTIVIGSVNSAGTLCVRIYDSLGTLPQPETYTITVLHP